MRARIATGSLALSIALSGLPASAAEGCSNDVFTIDGTVVTVAICQTAAAARPGASPAPIVLSETISAGGRSAVRQVTVEPLAGVDASRIIDDAPLDKIGIAKTLHLTIEYQPGNVKLAHALLVPGAVALK
jgi:hypothetical protein